MISVSQGSAVRDPTAPQLRVALWHWDYGAGGRIRDDA